MFWAWSLDGGLVTIWTEVLFCLLIVAPLLLSLEVDSSIGYQIRSILIKPTLILLVLISIVLPFATGFLSLAGFILIRVSIFCLVRLGVLSDCIHELTHVFDRSFDTAKFMDQWLKFANFLQYQDSYLSRETIRRMDYFSDSSCPMVGRLSFLLDTMFQVDDCGGAPACSLEFFDEFLLQF